VMWQFIPDAKGNDDWESSVDETHVHGDPKQISHYLIIYRKACQ